MKHLNEEYILLREKTLNEILTFIRKANGASNSNRIDERFDSPSTFFVNKSGQTIPAYGAFQIDGVEAVGGLNYLKAVRANDYSATSSVICFNSHNEVLDGNLGTIQDGPVYRARVESGESYDVGDKLGVKASDFVLELGANFVCLGDDDIEDDCVRVMFDHSTIIGIVEDSIEAGDSGVVHRLVRGSGGWAKDDTKDYIGHVIAGGDIEAGATVKMIPVDGVFSLVEVCD